MAGVWYCTREDVKRALDSKTTARDDEQVDRAIETGARNIEGLLHRRFYPLTATRRFDWPNQQYARPWRLWLDSNELVSVTTLTAGGTAIASGDYLLRRSDDRDETPYTHIEIDLSSQASFASGPSHQQSIVVTGVWCGCPADETPAGALAEALDDSETGVDVTNGAVVGVGTILRCDSERMIVTGRTMLDTGSNLGGNLTASAADVLVPVTGVNVGEVILIDAERMLVVDTAGSNVVVKRAWDGSVLATHSNGADVYASRTLTVQRAALGTTAATHLSATALAAHVVPGPVRDLNVAEAIAQIHQEQAAYARTAGAGENEREARALGLRAAQEAAYTAYGRKARIRAI